MHFIWANSIWDILSFGDIFLLKGGILYKYVLYCWGYSILEEHFILSFILYIVCCAIWAQMNGGVGNNGKRHGGVNNTVNVYYIQRGENHETCHQWPGLFNASAVFSFALSPSLFCYIMSGAGRARESRNTHSPTKRDWGTPSGDFFFFSFSFYFFPIEIRQPATPFAPWSAPLMQTSVISYTHPQCCALTITRNPNCILHITFLPPLPVLNQYPLCTPPPPYSHITLSALFRFSFSFSFVYRPPALHMVITYRLSFMCTLYSSSFSCQVPIQDRILFFFLLAETFVVTIYREKNKIVNGKKFTSRSDGVTHRTLESKSNLVRSAWVNKLNYFTTTLGKKKNPI